MRLTETQKQILETIRREQKQAGRCPCRGSNDLCGCQNKDTPMTDTSKEGVERLAVTHEKEPTLPGRGKETAATLRALSTALEEARSREAGALGAAYEAAASYVQYLQSPDTRWLHANPHQIRALTPASSQAALEAMKERVRQEERERCARIADEFGKEVEPQDGSYVRHSPVTGNRIAAAIRKGENDSQ